MMKSKLIDKIVALLQNDPLNWECMPNTIDYQKGENRVSIWFGNDDNEANYHIYEPIKLRLTYFQRLRLKLAVSRWKVDYINSKIS